ncbi:MAG: hypothetical protein R6V01_03710 [Thermoplasmatota archaeon]
MNGKDKTWRIEMIQDEIDSYSNFIEDLDPLEDEEYEIFSGLVKDLRAWLEDIKEDRSHPLEEEEVYIRKETIDNLIGMHQSLLDEDPTLSDEDRVDIRKIMDDLEGWKEDIGKMKGARS